MKRFLTAMIGALALALPAAAADAPAKAPTTKAYRMDPATGSFHKKHTQKLKLDCNTCHDSTNVDVLVVRASGGQGSPGAINREACRG